MAINGIASVLYGVHDVPLCTRYFDDFGLPLVESSNAHALFRLPNGSTVVLRSINDPAIPQSKLVGTGVHETTWGVDTAENLEILVRDLARDREVRRDSDGTAHTLTDGGLAIALKIFQPQPVRCAPDPINSPGNINRLNQHRKWKTRARPKHIEHVVFQVPDPDQSWAFFRDRLNFRLSDIQRGFGIFGRAPGANNHHHIYLLNSNLPFEGLDGQMRFDHVNYAVEDLDEIMIGTNYMERKGWPKSVWGLGRHRIASALFMYLPCPTGGQAEYGADSDALDDNQLRH
jgi:catechol 2,3-dioxygenase-like lactoylglutathione lyase family enzyme